MAFESCSSPEDILLFVGNLARNNEAEGVHFGSFTPSIYDSAWMSMVYKTEALAGKESEKWMFPQCLKYVLSLQRQDGTWPAFSSTVDGILSTSASILALLHRKSRLSSPDQDEIAGRVEKGIFGLKNLLQTWDVGKSDQVGFEIIVPNILSQITQYGIEFDFPGQAELQVLHSKKVQKFHPDFLYSDSPSTILHSLEALVGLVDFDRLKHHCSTSNGVMASPAATSAYLIHSSNWDDRAEAYLSHVVSSSGDCSGGVPAAFPTGNFEVSWALSTIFLHVELPSHDQVSHLSPLCHFLESLVFEQKGLVGWAPGIIADADDTARVLMTINMLGGAVDFTPMISKFRSGTSFKTYEMERNPSLSANCNILLALASSGSLDNYTEEVNTLMNYLLDHWRSGDVSDKWNTSSHYSCMLLCLALAKVVQRSAEGSLTLTSRASTERNVILCIVQMASMTLARQSDDGSWDNSLEVTSYCVLTLAQMIRLPFNQEFISGRLNPALVRGQAYIRAHFHDVIEPNRNTYIWTEKISYSTRLLRKVYSVAALNANVQPLDLPGISPYLRVPAGFEKIKNMLRSIPMFQNSPPVSWHLVLLEAGLWSVYLQEAKYDVFPPFKGLQGKDKHISLIPAIFTVCNHASRHTLSPSTVWEMIYLSLLVYQADELMEYSVTHLSTKSLVTLRRLLEYECIGKWDIGSSLLQSSLLESQPPSINLGKADIQEGWIEEDDSHKPGHLCVDEVMGRLRPLIRWLSQHPKVLESSPLMQREFSWEVYNFLSAHITHLESNIDLSRTHRSNNPDYHRWVGTVGADDTSCPLGSLFFICLTSGPKGTAFESSPFERYLSRSVFRHLAIMCRQYNDYGSVRRDMDEDNLNSLHFPEFLPSPSNKTEERVGVIKDLSASSKSMKEQLLAIAEFERTRMDHALKQLESISLEKEALASLHVFVAVTDLFGLMYIHEDFTNRVKPKVH